MLSHGLADVKAVGVFTVDGPIAVVVFAIDAVGTRLTAAGCAAGDVLASAACVVVIARAIGVVVITLATTGWVYGTLWVIAVDEAIAVVIDAVCAVELLGRFSLGVVVVAAVIVVTATGGIRCALRVVAVG